MSAAQCPPPPDQEGLPAGGAEQAGGPERDETGPEPEATEPGDASPPGAATAAEPRRGADDPVLPSQTADDTDTDWRDRDDSGDDHYLRERPPHW